MKHKMSLKAKALFFIVVFLLLFLLFSESKISYAQSNNVIGNRVIVITVSGVIDSAVEEYVSNAIAVAEKEHAILVIYLNTPGGLLDSAMNIAIDIDKSTIPVIGFVVDKWAESAGTLIFVCTHIAAMQPGTIIGSMQPIEYDPTTGTYTLVNDTKIINPILKFLDEHAGNKDRNLTSIHDFVLENLNLGPQEALEYHVINYIAYNIDDLLRQINGTQVYLPGTNITYIINTSSYTLEYFDMNIREYIVHAISDPTLSTLMLSLGMMIILFGILSGHLGVVPAGILLLLLGFVGNGYSISATSILLILFGSILLVVEHFISSFGVAGGIGIVMIVLGIALAPTSIGFSFSEQYAQSVLYSAYAVGVVLGAITAFIIYKIIAVRRRKPFSWKLEGALGKAVDPISPDNEGFVVIDGEYWKAKSESESISPGDEVIVVKKEGPILIVRKRIEK